MEPIMSGLCIINLKKHNLNEETMNEMANKLIRVSLKNHVAVHFNGRDYGQPLVDEEKMRDFFVLSHTFLYKNCDFLDLEPLMLKLYKAKDFQNFIQKEKMKNSFEKEKFQEMFCHKYNFFNEIIESVFLYDVNLIEIFMTENYGWIQHGQDFAEIKTQRRNFLLDLFNSLVDVLGNNFNYEFPNAKFVISKD